MSLDEQTRRLTLIKLRAKIKRAERRGGQMPELVLRSEAEDESEPLDLVDMLELELRD